MMDYIFSSFFPHNFNFKMNRQNFRDHIKDFIASGDDAAFLTLAEDIRTLFNHPSVEFEV
ncbi:hypothetical protein BDB01DRAFT_809313 [Pilobolus umbonatus]|nr:hypothetical protein BDB01DRAFT_809313 [Pilobolus umbonatus]